MALRARPDVALANQHQDGRVIRAGAAHDDGRIVRENLERLPDERHVHGRRKRRYRHQRRFTFFGFRCGVTFAGINVLTWTLIAFSFDCLSSSLLALGCSCE